MTRDGLVDGWRAIAAASVVLSHGKHLIGTKWEFLGWGAYWGVELFFIISGFLLVPQIKKIVDNGQLADVWVFFIRRIIRIIPLYYFFVYIATLVYPIKNFFPYLFFLQGVSPLYFPESWSLQTEELFYSLLIIAALAGMLLKIRLNAALLMIVLVMPILRLVYFQDYGDQYDAAIRKNALFRIDSLAIGGLFGIYVLRINRFCWQYGFIGLVIILAITICSSLIYTVKSEFGVALLGPLSSVSIGLVFVSTYNLRKCILSKLIDSFVLRMLGRASYPLYLVNVPLLIFLNLYFEDLSFYVYLILCVVLAILLRYLVERQFDSIGKKFRYSFKS